MANYFSSGHIKTSLDNSRDLGIIEALKGVFSILCLTVFLSACVAFSKEPGQVAVDFLEKVREKKVDLKVGADTALSPHITERKRKLIEESVGKLSSQIGKGKLFAGSMLEDGDYAAVMVLRGDESDQIKYQVYPVALVKFEDGWRAAPMLASFENSVIAYSVAVRERISKLEEWMMQQRVLEIESLRLRSLGSLKEKIKNRFKNEDLTVLDPVKIAERFQKAYAGGNQPEALAYLGGYSETWPGDWESRLETMRVAFSSKVRKQYPWRLLASSDVVRLVVDESVEEDEARVSMACLDPAWIGESRDMDGIQIIHFHFSKDEQARWILNLPESFSQNDKNAFLESQGMDDDLLEDFADRLRDAAPRRFAESFEQAGEEVIKLLENGSIEELFRWVDLERESVISKEACALAVKAWWSVRAPGVFCSPVKMGSRVEGDWAVVVYHWFAINKAERIEFKPMYFRKTESGWVWVPGYMKSVDPQVAEIFSGWIKGEEVSWRGRAMKDVYASVTSLDKLTFDRQVEDIEVKAWAEKWGSALQQKNIHELLHLSARLGVEEAVPQKIFRNLTYELALAQRAKLEFKGVYRTGKWVTAGFAHSDGDDRVFSMMLLVPTQQGLKVLSEIDLISDVSRTRKFLNKVSFDRLKTYVSEEELEEIKGLFEEFGNKTQ